MTPMACRLRNRLAWVLLLTLVGPLSTAIASDFSYDATGRLKGATAPSGNGAQYNYDAVGNILGVQPVAAGQLALFSFSPVQGTTGSQVSIQGSGFSASPSNNTVKFNGTTATVVSATANQLVVTVPSGATTGPISVTVNSTTATSSTNFVIGQAPTITGFSPADGNGGAVITVTGNALNPEPGATSVTLGSESVSLNSISNTQLTFTAPANPVSGPITVTTPFGTATSNSDFIVPPSGIDTANVVSAATLSAGGSAQSLNLAAATDYGVFAFNATANQWLSIQVNSLTTTPGNSSVSYLVYLPDNEVLASGSITPDLNMSIHLPPIPLTGTYLVLFVGGSGAVQLSAALVNDAAIVADGPAIQSSTNLSGQSKRFVFPGSVGQFFGVGFSQLSPLSISFSGVAYLPDTNSVTSNNCISSVAAAGCGLVLSDVPETGTYAVVLSIGAASSFTTTLSSPVTASLVPGTPQNVAIARPGQFARIPIAVSANQRLAIDITNLAMGSDPNVGVTISVLGPDGNALTQSYCVPSIGGCSLVIQSWPVNAVFSVLVIPDHAATGQFTARLSVVPPDGDLNGDGVVDVADVLLAERIALGLIAPTASQLIHADVAPAGAPDGIVDIADVMRIRRKALGLENF